VSLLGTSPSTSGMLHSSLRTFSKNLTLRKI
jgi:hypothetical protein